MDAINMKVNQIILDVLESFVRSDVAARVVDVCREASEQGDEALRARRVS